MNATHITFNPRSEKLGMVTEEEDDDDDYVSTFQEKYIISHTFIQKQIQPQNLL